MVCPVFYLLHCCFFSFFFFFLFWFCFNFIVAIVVVVLIPREALPYTRALTNRNVYACVVLTCHCIYTIYLATLVLDFGDRQIFFSRRLICLLTVFNVVHAATASLSPLECPQQENICVSQNRPLLLLLSLVFFFLIRFISLRRCYTFARHQHKNNRNTQGSSTHTHTTSKQHIQQ